MRRLLDLAAVLVVVTLVGLAVVDALRGEPDDASTADLPAGDSRLTEGAAALERLGASGRIVFSDPSCRRYALDLPSLAVAEIRSITGCRVFAQRGSLGVLGGEVAWHAFPGGRTDLLSRGQLGEALAKPVGSDHYAVERAAWLRSTRYAVLASGAASGRPVLAIFERATLVAPPLLLDRSYRELRSSRSFGYVAALSRHGGLTLLDRNGRTVARPPLPDIRAVAWSPDERLAVAATADGIAFFRPGSRAAPVAVVPVAAEDLDWLG
jgi:hypothetical protein